MLPTGTVTFLFTDIEGSTTRWERNRDAMQSALRHHDALLRAAVEAHGGVVFKTIGDAFCAVFSLVGDAIAAALEAQRAIAREDWSSVDGLHVRMAVHTGDGDERDGDYFGPVVNRVARLLSAGHGAQTLVSGVAADLAQGTMPPLAALRDLGLHRLKDLAYPEQVYQLTAPDLPLAFPPLRTLDALPNNLPLQLTTFLGRDDEVAAIRALLERSRLVTLVGSGGVGKTRTSLQVGAELLDRYPDGTWLLELAPLRDPGVIESVLATAMGIRGGTGGDGDNAVLDVLRGKKALLIFDNCEHLVRDAATVIDRILRSCPQITILASSREGLGIAGESTFRMPSLAVPARSAGLTADEALRYGAVSLFVERAQAASDTFALTDENAPDVAEICRQLDGIALAIELAAPRINVLAPRALLDRMKERFRLLTGGSRAALPRQQTMRALIDWSYDLLSEEEQRVFRRVAVFAGGWSIEGATAVCTDEDLEEWDFLDILSALVDKSLIVTELQAGAQRYRMLESTRQYARERLAQSGEQARFLRRHAEHFLAFATDLSEHYWDEPALHVRRRAEPELDNLRAALTWSLLDGNDPLLGVALAGEAVVPFSTSNATAEPRRWIGVARAHIGNAPPPLRARLAAGNAHVSHEGDMGTSLSLALEAQAFYAEAGDTRELVEVLNSLTFILCMLQRFPEAQAANARARELLVDHDWPLLYANTLRNGSLALVGAEHAPERIRMLNEAMSIFRARGDDLRAVYAMQWLCEDEFAAGALDAALGHSRELIGVLRDISPRSSELGSSLHNYSAYLLAADRPLEAYVAAREAAVLAHDLGLNYLLAFSVLVLGGIAARSDRPSSSVRGCSATR